MTNTIRHPPHLHEKNLKNNYLSNGERTSGCHDSRRDVFPDAIFGWTLHIRDRSVLYRCANFFSFLKRNIAFQSSYITILVWLPRCLNCSKHYTLLNTYTINGPSDCIVVLTYRCRLLNEGAKSINRPGLEHLPPVSFFKSSVHRAAGYSTLRLPNPGLHSYIFRLQRPLA